MSSEVPTSDHPFRSPEAVDARERRRRNSILTVTVVLWTLSFLAFGCIFGSSVPSSSVADVLGVSAKTAGRVGIIAGSIVGAAVGLDLGLVRVARLRRRWDNVQRDLVDLRNSIASL